MHYRKSCNLSALTLFIWLSPIPKIFLPSFKVQAYVLCSDISFGFCNCYCIKMYLSVVKIFGFLLMALSKIVFLSLGSTVELFSSTKICWGSSSTCNGEYKFWSSGTAFYLVLEPQRTVGQSFPVSFLMSLLWFSVSLSIIFNQVCRI